MHWAQIEDQGVLGYSLRLSGSFGSESPSRLVCDRRQLCMDLRGYMPIKTDGAVLLTLGDEHFKRHWHWFRLMPLKSQRSGRELMFDWEQPGPLGAQVKVSSVPAGDSFVAFVYRQVLQTRVRIESSDEKCDVNLMLGVLAFLWTGAERDRLS
jgi:hypothetical protein